MKIGRASRQKVPVWTSRLVDAAAMGFDLPTQKTPGKMHRMQQVAHSWQMDVEVRQRAQGVAASLVAGLSRNQHIV